MLGNLAVAKFVRWLRLSEPPFCIIKNQSIISHCIQKLTNMNQDILWKQRLANYQKALAQLTKFIDKGELKELEEQGLIQAFEYTHELA